MTPIESQHDVRLVTFIGVTINAFETLSLQLNVDSDLLLAETLYLVTKQLHEIGEEEYQNKLARSYPLLNTILD